MSTSRLISNMGAMKWESPPEAPREEVELSHGRVKQCIGTMAVSLASLNCGLSMRWVSSTPLALAAGVCPVEELPESSATSSLYASLIAALLMGLAASYGRKTALFLSSITNLVASAIFRDATSSTNWIGQTCVACNIITSLAVVPMFVSEIAQKPIRGTLMLSSIFPLHIGAMCAIGFEPNISQTMYSNIFMALSVIQLLLLIFIPETPYFLLSQQRNLEAEGSLFWYRGSNRSVAKGELSILLNASPNIHPTFISMLRNVGTKSALIVSVGLVFFKCLSGFIIFSCYSGIIWRGAGHPSSELNVTLLLITIQMISGILSIIFVDSVGRKLLLYVSQFGNIIFLSISGAYLMFESLVSEWGHPWLPFLCLGGFIFTSSVGVSVMTSVVTYEVTPIQTRGVVLATDGILTSILVLGSLQSSSFLAKNVGSYVNFVVPAVVNVMGLVFTWAVIPETKNTSLQAIFMKMNRQESENESVKMSVMVS